MKGRHYSLFALVWVLLLSSISAYTPAQAPTPDLVDVPSLATDVADLQAQVKNPQDDVWFIPDFSKLDPATPVKEAWEFLVQSPNLGRFYVVVNATTGEVFFKNEFH